MNLDELQTLWNAPGNAPTSAARNQMINRFTASLRRRRRRELAWLIWTIGVLTVLAGFAAWVLFGTDKVTLSQEWAIVPLLLIPCVCAGLFLKRFLRLPGLASGDITISESLSAALAANDAERRKLKTIGLMYLITLPVLAFSIWQLHAVGKASARELMSMVPFLGGALTLSAGAVLARYWLGLRPERRKLIKLLKQFE